MSPPVTLKPTEPVYRFGQFRLLSDSGELLRNGREEKLAEQPLQILLALLDRPGEIVSRNTLRERLWPQNTYVDFELGLNAAMKRLRRALHDDAVNPRFIETLPKRGYRLLVPVTFETADAPAPSPTELIPSTVEGSAEPMVPRPVSKRHWALAKWIFGLAGLAAVIAATSFEIYLLRPTAKTARRYNILLSEDGALAPASLMPLGVGRPDLAISHDGEQIVYAGVAGSSTELFLRTNTGNAPKPLPGTDGAHSPFFSPDDQWVGFFAEGKLKKVRLVGGPAIVLCDVVLGFGGSWADEDWIYFTPGERTSIYRIPASGGVPAQVTPRAEQLSLIGLYWPQKLPDSSKGIIFGNSRSGIAVFDLASGKYEMLTRSGSFPRWSPTGHILYVDDGVLWALPFDAKSLRKTGPPALVLDHVRMEQQGAAQFTVSDDGTLVYAPGGDAAEASLVWVSVEGTVQDAGLPPSRYQGFQISPNGKTLALAIRDGSRSDLWSYDLERKVLSRLTDDGHAWGPIWNRDGTKIAYPSRSSGTMSLFEMNADGSHRRTVAALPGLLAATQYTLDDKAIVAAGFEPDGHWVDLVDTISGQKTELDRSPFPRMFPVVSPDGQWFAYVSDETGRWEVYVRAIGHSNRSWRISTAGGEEPIWARSGRKLFYRYGDRWLSVNVSLNSEFRASEPVQVLEGPYVNIPGYSYDLALDSRFLMLKSDYQDKKLYQLNIVENLQSLLAKNVRH